jgi:UPF0755 protein
VQIDELDLAWDDEADRGRHRHRRSGGGRSSGKGRAGRSFIALIISLVVLVALGAGVWFGINKVQDFFAAPDYNSGGTNETVTIEVLDGQTATDIGQTLQQKGVVKSAKAFVNAAKANEKSKTIQPGFYELRKQMRAADALSLLLDPASKKVSKVTLPEGLTYQETFAKLSQGTGIPVSEFEALAKDPVALGIPDFWFTRQDKKPVQKSIEGFLFPATYDFNPGVDAKTVLTAVIKKFNDEMAKLDFINKVQTNLHISPYEALIAASIAQVEGIFPDDQANIARVLYNRVYTGKFPCNCLQLDSTVNYWLKISGRSAKPSQELLHSELHNPNDPYNTHDVPGLPIGPISNPGNTALTGAMAPPKTDYMYFVAVDKEGHTKFATTYAQHQQNIALAKKNGVL